MNFVFLYLVCCLESDILIMCNYVYFIFLFVLLNVVFVILKKNGLMNSIFIKNIFMKRKKKYNFIDYIKEFKLLVFYFNVFLKMD